MQDIETARVLVQEPAGSWSAEPVIVMEHVTVTYDGSRGPALCDVDLEVQPGEFVLVTGASGCGKTTLARCLNGLIPHLISAQTSGRVEVAGMAPFEEQVSAMAARVGMVFQVPEAQLFNLIVEEEVAFGCRNLGLEPEEVARRVDFALNAVGMAQMRKRTLYQMSGGEKQLAAIASVLAMQPDVLVLDEPLSNLDGRSVERVLDVLTSLNQAGMTVMLIEHRTHQVADAASRVVVMHEGRIVLDGGPEILGERKALLKRLGVRVPGAFETSRRLAGQDDAHSDQTDAEANSLREVVVSVQGVDFGYDRRKKVLEGVSLEVRRGECVALLGDSGAGKTTLAHLIAGALKPKAGTVRVSGGGNGGQKVGLLLQNPTEQLFCDTVEEEVRFGPDNYGMAADELVDSVLALTDLDRLRGEEVQHLSRGQQQRLSLASVLVLAPGLLILDEPTLGQDWGHMVRFMDFIKGLQSKGAALLLITHDRELADRYADRIVRLSDGRIVA